LTIVLPAEEGIGLDVRGQSFAKETVTGVVDKYKFATVTKTVIKTQTT
jgi:hypothetical protein